MPNVSVYRGSTNPRPVSMRSLWQVLDAIQDGTYRRQVQRLRELLRTQGEEAYNIAKRTLDAFTPCGTFAPTRAKSNLQQPSGIAHGDLDHLADVETVKQCLAADPSLVYVFISPSGAGLKIGVRVDACPDDATYKHAWQAVATAHQQAYGLTWDPSGKDVSRLSYLSWDPALYRNPNAQRFPVPPPVPQPALRQTTPRIAFDVPRDRRERYARQAIETAVAMIDASTSGNRHHARLRAAELLGGYVAGGLLSYDEAWGALAQVVARNSEHPDRSMKTIADGLNHGQERPIPLEELETERQDWLARHQDHVASNSGVQQTFSAKSGRLPSRMTVEVR